MHMHLEFSPVLTSTVYHLWHKHCSISDVYYVWNFGISRFDVTVQPCYSKVIVSSVPDHILNQPWVDCCSKLNAVVILTPTWYHHIKACSRWWCSQVKPCVLQSWNCPLLFVAGCSIMCTVLKLLAVILQGNSIHPRVDRLVSIFMDRSENLSWCSSLICVRVCCV